MRREDSNLQWPDPESGGLPISRLLNARRRRYSKVPGPSRSRRRRAQARDRALAPEHVEHLVDARAHRAAGHRAAHGLRQRAPLELLGVKDSRRLADVLQGEVGDELLAAKQLLVAV